MDREGIYFGSVTGGKSDTARTGSPQIVVSVNLTHWWDGKAWEPLLTAIDRKVYLSLAAKAIPYTMEKLEALGFNGDFKNPEFTENPDRSKRPKFHNKHNEYNGKVSDRYDIVGKFGSGDGARQGIADEVAADLARQWKQRKGDDSPPDTGGPDDAPF